MIARGFVVRERGQGGGDRGGKWGKGEISTVCAAELNLGGGVFDIGAGGKGLTSRTSVYKHRTGNTYVWTSHRSQMGSALSSLVHPEGHGLPCPDHAWLKAGL